MDPSVLGARLASSAIAPLVKKLFVTEGPGAGLVDQPVRLSAYVSFRGERRTLSEAQLHRLAGRLVREAVTSPGERAFPADEAIVIADALATTLLALGDLDMDDVQAVQLGHRELAKTLRTRAAEAAAPPPDHHLSADAALFLSSAVEWACLHVLHFFTQRSTFIARTLVAQSRVQAETIAKLDELITRAPRPDTVRAAFERRYRTHVATKHSKLTIYGIDLTATPGAWPLDLAYLSLTSTEEPVEPPRSGALADHLTAPRPATTHLADRVLATHSKVLLRGVAGSGKTTLVQWLAVSATRAAPDGPLAHLYDLVPFVLPLRTLTRHGERLPGPERFLDAIGSPLAGAQPQGWADHVLTSGRALVLVDGIDEVPDVERDRTRTWLGDLVTAYPGNRWLVTSRPSAVREDWLADEGFTELTLSPMSRTHVDSFIHRWHSAARHGTDAPTTALLDSYERQLLTAVTTKPDLGRLATNPLMCGLICALHRDRRGYLPHGRKELYEAALAMLLARRDRERDVLTTVGLELRQEPQTQLLQRLAYWLIRNGRTELDRDRAEAIIGEALPAVPEAAALGGARTVFAHLLLRSGLLLEPSPGAVTFVHRTFQDYLGARRAVEEWDIGLLTRHAADDQWEDVIRMAVGHARPRERAEILDGLVAAGDRAAESRDRSRIHLLAAACLEHATELDPAVRTRIGERLYALIPPVDREAARELATVGPLVLDLLPGPGEWGVEESLMVVITASRIESDAAIPFLARYAHDPSLSVRSQLAWSWYRFDTARYAEEVIARVDPEGISFSVRSEKELRVLGELGGRPRVQLTGRIGTDAIASYVSRYQPQALTILNHRSLTGLQCLRDAEKLHSLVIQNCDKLLDLSTLTALPALRRLDYTANRHRLPWESFEALAELDELAVWALHPGMSPDDWESVGAVQHMTELGLDAELLTTMPDTLVLPKLRRLALFYVQQTNPVDVSSFAARFPRLTQLRIPSLGGDEVRLHGFDRLPETVDVVYG
ncbi:NACHT domain-containing protein [Streptomyces sp. NPDC059578]|uniref:NACHT domain-containing protein n=1 Tax=Streptomyces sp. NPDC059578 TaxID=3346874 RepID=UPI00369ADA50